MHGAMLQVNVLESAMPTMITAGALAIAHNLAPRLAAALVGYGILLSLVTLPAWCGVDNALITPCGDRMAAPTITNKGRKTNGS